MDKNGFGQPAALGFLANEQAATLKEFFRIFKQSTKDWTVIQTLFVDRDFTQIGVLEHELPGRPVLVCAFHVMKTLKLNISRVRLDKDQKRILLTLFQAVLYARTQESFKDKEAEFIELCPPVLRRY